jgi:hypothetical protein
MKLLQRSPDLLDSTSEFCERNHRFFQLVTRALIVVLLSILTA